MTQVVYATFDPAGAPIIIPPEPFSTHWVKASDSSETEAYGVQLGEVFAEERQHAWDQLESFAAEDLDHYRIFRFAFAEPAWGEVFAGATLSVDAGGAIQAQPVYEARPLAELRAEKVSEVLAIYAGKVAAGYPVITLGPGETLQCRDTTDEARWLAFQGRCAREVQAGNGAATAAQLIRTSSNTNHQVTYAQGLSFMDGLTDWAGGLLAVLWSHKDAIAAAPNAAALAAIDLTAGWPA